MNNPFAMMGGMPGLAGLMGMGGAMGGGAGLNSSQLSSMWGGAAGPRGRGGITSMGFNRGMMDQVSQSDELMIVSPHVNITPY